MLLSCPQRATRAEVGAVTGGCGESTLPLFLPHLDDPLQGQPVEFQSGQRARGFCRKFIIGFETSCSGLSGVCVLSRV